MGGGGGSGAPSERDITTLGEIAKRSLQASASGKRNVFISFAGEDLAEVNLLRGQAKNDNAPFEFNDWSLREPFDSKRAEYIQQGIRERIAQSSVTVVYLSEHSARSRWVDWEIRESLRLGKGVVGVYKGDAPPRDLPVAFTEYGLTVVRWSYDELSRAIDTAAKARE